MLNYASDLRTFSKTIHIVTYLPCMRLPWVENFVCLIYATRHLVRKEARQIEWPNLAQHSWTQCLNIGHLYRCSTLKSGDDVVLEIDCFEKSSRTHICEPKTSVGT